MKITRFCTPMKLNRNGIRQDLKNVVLKHAVITATWLDHKNYDVNTRKTHLRVSLITNTQPLYDVILQTFILCFVFFCPTQVAPLTHNL
jgi:hypothetical protein